MKTLKLITLIMILVAVIGFNFTIGGSTGKITGAILKKEDKSLIPGASVMIEGTTIGAKVNPMDGSYVIQYVPPGTYTLIAGCLGRYDFKVEGVVVHADTTTEQNFVLTSKPIEVDVYSGPDSPPQFNKFETGKITRLSQSDIKKLPAKNIQDILKAF